ncbi:MAG: glycosyltransferase [Phycisphaeraceae bacterium]|nr:glycosyltransferase [Phycisphaeraceae bacterium]
MSAHEGNPRPQLVVFSDDWARHPSSAQHMVKHLLARWDVLWVNTIGTRWPRLCREDAAKVAAKLKVWTSRRPRKLRDDGPANLQVVSPIMWPGFRKPWQRRFNAKRMIAAVTASLGPRQPGIRRVAMTTLPIAADLVGKLDVDRWVYYCVDDLAAWPGLDSTAMSDMETHLVSRADDIVAVSHHLAGSLRTRRESWEPRVLTHGIDLQHWSQATLLAPPWLTERPRPWMLFWGLVDRRLDVDWCMALAKLGGTLALVGPTQDPHPRLLRADHIVMPGPMDYRQLPALAAAADVLVMPYADQPVTRAMQPLKFKEYLATGRPVVTRLLPGILDWTDAADLVVDADDLVRTVAHRAATGAPSPQLAARQRLNNECWSMKARELEEVLVG